MNGNECKALKKLGMGMGVWVNENGCLEVVIGMRMNIWMNGELTGGDLGMGMDVRINGNRCMEPI